MNTTLTVLTVCSLYVGLFGGKGLLAFEISMAHVSSSVQIQEASNILNLKLWHARVSLDSSYFSELWNKRDHWIIILYIGIL